MPRCALLTALKNYQQKSWKTARLFLQKTETKTKCSRPRLHDPRPRLSFLSSRRHRYQDPGLEDYITGRNCLWMQSWQSMKVHRQWLITYKFSRLSMWMCTRISVAVAAAINQQAVVKYIAYTLNWTRADMDQWHWENVPCGLQRCRPKNRPAPFPGRMSYKTFLWGAQSIVIMYNTMYKTSTSVDAMPKVKTRKPTVVVRVKHCVSVALGFACMSRLMSVR